MLSLFTLALTLLPVGERPVQPPVAMPAASPVRDKTFAQSAPLRLNSVVPVHETVPRFGKLELALDLQATFGNPFDPDDISITATFVSPQNKPLSIPAFYSQLYARHLENGSEVWTATGLPGWVVRFAPDTVGTWRYRITARDRTGTITSELKTFRVVESRNSGFVRRSARNPIAFALEGEKPFFPVGENMGWGDKRGSFAYDDWLSKLSKAGGNAIRVWMSSWNGALEWARETKGDWRNGTYHGVGVYSLDNAAKIDAILDAAEQRGIYTMLCLGTYGEFTIGGPFNEGQWKANPYNVVNGGPCARPEEFWTNVTARKLYRQRLRYIAARYGWRTHIWAWEFWNETNPPAAWVAEMAHYLKGTGAFADSSPADPHRHLVTTSYGSPAIWKIPEIDITQTHSYGTGNIADHAPVAYNDTQSHLVYGKPHIMGEFGIDWRKADSDYDPNGTGINLHNGMWASLVAGGGGAAMIWWWDNYVDPKNVYAPFTAVRAFADRIPWTTGKWRTLQTDGLTTTGTAETFSDLRLPAASGWGKAAVSDFTVTPHGLASSAVLPQFLYSPGKPDLRTTPIFHVRFARPGRFAVHVDEVSAASTLRFLLDGQPAGEFALSASPPADPNTKPDYEKTEWMAEYKSYRARFNKEYSIPVPTGGHAITIENVSGDWASVTNFILTDYRSSRYPDANLYGLTNGNEAILWAQNARHNWKNVASKVAIPPIASAITTVHGLVSGQYTVEWWDTTAGTVIRRDHIVGNAGGLRLRFPVLATDVAARIVPIPTAPAKK